MRSLRNHIVLRRLLCLLLCAATWRGPVVWFHSHSDQERSQQADVLLSSHLLRFHQESPPAHGSPEWHLHFGLLRDLMTDGFGEDGVPSAPSTDEPILLATTGASVPLAATNVELTWSAVWISLPALPVPAIPEEISRGSFLQTYGTAPLRLLTSVIRC